MSGILLARRAGGATTRIVLPAVGDAWLGGFFAGVADSSQSGAIPANDNSKTPLRYALIDLGAAAEPPAGTLAYKTTNDAAPAATNTVWDGLTATQAMTGATYPAGQYANGFSVPDDGASQAYLPSMWEMLMLYWQFKPFTNDNYTTAETSSTFPGGTVTQGLNPLSDPQRPAFTTAVPGQTLLAMWRTSGAQAFQDAYYWTATEYSATYAWRFSWSTGIPGGLRGNGKYSNARVRLVRRLVLSS